MEFITMQEPGGRETNKNLPCISCVCITRKKPALLQRAIGCYLDQSYPNKELVIVYEDDDTATARFMENEQLQSRPDIRIVCVRSAPKTSLGELRNLGIKAAQGEYICQWDDDDWYHKDRLTTQFNVLAKTRQEGAIMTQWLVFDAVRNKAYISNTRVWEGSILCRKSVLQAASYADVAIGEDTPAIEYLVEQDCLSFIDNNPGLYIYIYHGGNTWHHAHWQHIFACSIALAPRDSAIVEDILNGTYSVYSGSLLLDRILHNRQNKNSALTESAAVLSASL